MSLKREEKDFLRAWANLYKCPPDTIVVRSDQDLIKIGGMGGWFQLIGKFKGMKKDKIYTIEELL